MRKADIDHSFAKCREEDRRRLSVISISAARSVIPLRSRLLGIIGQNGAGKTRLLQSIGTLVATGHQTPIPVETLSVIFQGKPLIFRTGEKVESTLKCILLDPSRDAHKTTRFFKLQPDLPEILNQYDFSVLKETENGIYRHLLSKNYNKVEIAEIPMPKEGDGAIEEEEIAPFFRVTSGNHCYDSLSMGFGELCAFTLIWNLSRVEPGSIVLIDEPDSHLSPATRSHLPDVFAHFSAKRELWLAFTSHSLESIASLDDGEITLIECDTDDSAHRLDIASHKRQALRTLGINSVKRLLIVVEDVDAKEVVHQIVNTSDSIQASSVDIQIVPGGSDRVRDLTTLYPEQASAAQLLAVLDGDMREKFAEQPRISFLPGRGDPIAEARDYALRHPDGLASRLNISKERLVVAFKTKNHIDHHDFCRELVSALGFENFATDHMRRHLISHWLSDPATTPSVSELVLTIDTMLNDIPFSH